MNLSLLPFNVDFRKKYPLREEVKTPETSLVRKFYHPPTHPTFFGPSELSLTTDSDHPPPFQTFQSGVPMPSFNIILRDVRKNM